MLIVEGVDGSGKSTLVRKIAEHLVSPAKQPVKVVHSPGALDFGLYGWAIKHLKEAEQSQIFDRFPYFSESVYGPLLRGSRSSLLDIWEFTVLREELLRFRPMVIICRPSKNLIIGRTSLVRRQMDGVLDNLDQLLDRYDRFTVHWAMDFRIVIYDFTHEDAGDLIFTQVEEYLKEDPERGKWER